MIELRNRLKKPTRLAWATRDYFYPEYPEGDGADSDFHLLVLCSASKRVHGAEMSEGGYIQGAGDDSEGWACGLTAPIFWKYRETLFDAGEENLPTLIKELTDQECQIPSSEERVLIKPTSNIYIGKNQGTSSSDIVIDCNAKPDTSQNTKQLCLGCPSGKLGSRHLRRVLSKASAFASSHLARDPSQSIVITCDDGKDLSVGTALMIICSFYDDNGRLYLLFYPIVRFILVKAYHLLGSRFISSPSVKTRVR